MALTEHPSTGHEPVTAAAVEAAKQFLIELRSAAEAKTKRKETFLTPLREEIQLARTAGASYKAISESLRKAGLKYSQVEVGNFCRNEFGDKKNRHSKKRVRKSNIVNYDATGKCPTHTSIVF